MRLVVLLLIIGFPVALILAWAFELTPEGIKRAEDVDLSESTTRRTSHKLLWMTAVVAIVAAALFVGGRFNLFRSQRGAATPVAGDKSIAVLPFVDLSQAKDQEYFCDGISEEILDALAKVEGLRVVARTSSFSFKGKNADVSEIGQKLNVQSVLEGSLRREGNRIRITAQLVSARDGFHIWSDTFERELQGVFAVQDEITRSIVDALKIKLAVAPPARAQQNTEAYDLYLQALYLSNKSDEENLRESLNLFQRALDKDPNLARAWTGIAKAWYWLADAYIKPLEAYPAVESAAAKALELNERDADAHSYLGEAERVLRWDWNAAERELKRAFEVDPNSSTAHAILGHMRRYLKAGEVTHEPTYGLAITYARLGRVNEARHVLQQLIDKANRSYVAAEQIASVFVALGDRDEAFRWLDRAMDEHSVDPIATRRELRPLHSDARFPELLRRMGIDPTKVVGRQTAK